MPTLRPVPAPADTDNSACDTGSQEVPRSTIPVTEHASRILTEADHADRAQAGRMLEDAMQVGRCSQEQLAHAAGISRVLVSRTISGDKRLGTDKLLRLARNPRTARVVESYANELARIARESRRTNTHEDLLTLVMRAAAEGGDVSRVAVSALNGVLSRESLMELRREAVEAREADEAIIRAIDAKLAAATE